MRNSISRLAAFMVSRRLGLLLMLIHFVLVVYAICGLPLANPDSWDSEGGCHGIPIADRTFFFCDATGLLRLVGIIDFVGVVLFAIFATFFGWLPMGSFHVFSWIVALVLLVVTSFQWMLIGNCIARFFRWLARDSLIT